MKPIDRLLEIMARLQEPGTGCPWVIQQTHASLAPYLIEEAYEAAEVMEGKNPDELRDELGDILLQVVFHSQVATRAGTFDFDAVAQTIADKIERRYSHIEAELKKAGKSLHTASCEERDALWNDAKKQERANKDKSNPAASILDGVSRALPALTRARKVKERCAAAGWEWKTADQQIAKIAEEAREIQDEIDAGAPKEKIAHEIGDMLFILMDFARINGIDAEDALRTTTDRVEKRFRHMESGLKNKGKDIKNSSREERTALWEEAKQIEKKAS